MNEELNWKFTNDASLAMAAKAAGFQPSKDLGGYVDTIARIDTEKVRINGWAADLVGDGSPITLNVFMNGHKIATFRTNGPRDDITLAIRANPKANQEASKNTQFVAIFSCAAGSEFFVVATTTSKSYLLLPPRPTVCH